MFGVPSYITDNDLSEKLSAYGCVFRSNWTHKTYKEFPNIENGIRFVRLELPNTKVSLPYAIVVNGLHLRLKHNGQQKVCNLCLEQDHIMKNCPEYNCRECGQQGHSEARCPEVKCFKCNNLGHKSFNCPEADEGNEVEMDTVNEDKPTKYVDDVDSKAEVRDKEKTIDTRNNTKVSNEVNEVVPVMNVNDGNRNVEVRGSDKPKDTGSNMEDMIVNDKASTSRLCSQPRGSTVTPSTKRNLSCDETDDSENSQDPDASSQPCGSLSRPKKHITPNLMLARKFTPREAYETKKHGDHNSADN
ncbi:hypothetical protein HOLleu_29723 [Holothuria leucospilota]|uniref:CCHC-type domain-containing protein n=1 Tax=Holothuria leucospilota TaxID=206669 RepID=A0A9Q1BJC2_HOLLE|nr:hypothetical protein HOLleu_29723 [Holothuria leucospilota]